MSCCSHSALLPVNIKYLSDGYYLHILHPRSCYKAEYVSASEQSLTPSDDAS